MKNSVNNSRRSFIVKSAAAITGIALLKDFSLKAAGAGTGQPLPGSLSVDGVFILPELGYGYAALEPFIDEATMTIHHTKHHQAYVNKLNEAIEKAPELKGKPLKDLLSDIQGLPESVRNAVRNHGGGHFNHTMYWKILQPAGTENQVSPELLEAITARWQSMDAFKSEFSKAATGVFGSGWAWLVQDKENKLQITTTPNQDNPLMDVAPLQGRPILGIDVWEHAYYLKHQNKRADHIADFMQLINWNQVSQWFKG